ncbi:MAG: hypothetical protein RJA30_526, partial [Actinomycetota bacterium]
MTARMLPVTPGLAGQRADAGLAKLLGMSRNAVADLLTEGCVYQNGKLLGKSDRLIEDGLLEVTLPEPKNPLEIVPVEVPGFKVVFEDSDIVVVDKPAGVASH